MVGPRQFLGYQRLARARRFLPGRGDDTVGNPHRAQIYQFELFELTLLLQERKQFSVEQFEAAVSQSTVSSPRLIIPSSAHDIILYSIILCCIILYSIIFYSVRFYYISLLV